MTTGRSRGLMLAILGGVALVSAPGLANDLSGDRGLTGNPRLIAPGVSSLSAVDVNAGPMDAGVFVAPDVSFGLPVVATIPERGWAPIELVTGVDTGAY